MGRRRLGLVRVGSRQGRSRAARGGERFALFHGGEDQDIEEGAAEAVERGRDVGGEGVGAARRRRSRRGESAAVEAGSWQYTGI